MTMCRHCGYAGSACDCVDRRAQPAAPAVCSSCDGTGKISGLPCAWCMQSAAPSVAPEPVAWTLQSELDAAQTTCSAHLWFTNPRNSAWTALFTREKSAAHPPRAPLTDEHPYTYTSTQATNCAGCGEYKHTPLRIDAMGGYVCLTCIDKKLGTVLGEFGYPAPQAPLTEEQKRDLVKECDLDWQRGFMPLFDGDPTNRYAVLIDQQAVKSDVMPLGNETGMTDDERRTLGAWVARQ